MTRGSEFHRDRRVLVLGGTGFVGTHMVEALLAAGARVRITVHQRPPIVTDPRVETVQADLTDVAQAVAAMDGIDDVYHCAGAVSAAGVTVNDPMGPIADNVVLTARVLQAAWRAEVDRILVFSSSTAYPATEHPVHEDELWDGPVHPVYFGYGWMRRYIERMAEFLARRSKTRVALVRPTAIYGPHDNFDPKTSHVIPALIRRALAREAPFVVWGTGDEMRDFLHVKDMIAGCLLLMEKHPTCQPVNIGLGEVVTIRDVVQAILTAAGYADANVQYDASKPTTIPRRLVDVGRAREVLGFQPTYDLATGLKDTVDWYRATLTAPLTD